MNRLLQIGSVLLLVVGASYGDDQQTKEPQPPPAKPAAPKAAPKAGVPKAAPIPPGAARLVNPANLASLLYRMSPEQRDRALEKLPLKQQENLRKQLEWFDNLPKEQQQNQLHRLDRVAQLSPEKQAEVKGLIVEANSLPGPRATAVRQALFRLQQMSDQERETTLRRQAFRDRFSTEELRIITGLADAWMGPVQ